MPEVRPLYVDGRPAWRAAADRLWGLAAEPVGPVCQLHPAPDAPANVPTEQLRSVLT